MKMMLITSLLLLSISACYYNPIVHDLLDPVKSESNANLALLALGSGNPTSLDATLQVLGQIKDLSSNNIASPTLTIAQQTSTSAKEAVSVSVTGNNSGKFLLKLRTGSYLVAVKNASGSSLGSFLLNVSSTNTVTTSVVSGSSFSVSILSTYAIGDSVTVSEDATVILPPTITSFSPTTGSTGVTITINGTNFSTVPSENTVVFTGTGCSVSPVSASTTTSLTVTFGGGGQCVIYVTVNGITVNSTGLTPPQFCQFC